MWQRLDYVLLSCGSLSEVKRDKRLETIFYGYRTEVSVNPFVEVGRFNTSECVAKNIGGRPVNSGTKFASRTSYLLLALVVSGYSTSVTFSTLFSLYRLFAMILLRYIVFLLLYHLLTALLLAVLLSCCFSCLIHSLNTVLSTGGIACQLYRVHIGSLCVLCLITILFVWMHVSRMHWCFKVPVALMMLAFNNTFFSISCIITCCFGCLYICVLLPSNTVSS
jgi:hypothetical protein